MDPQVVLEDINAQITQMCFLDQTLGSYLISLLILGYAMQLS